MDILKVAMEWAKSELVSTFFFIVIGIAFFMASFGFWQFGKTDLARAYIIPILVAGAFLTTVGFGLFFTNKARIIQFETTYNNDASAFVALELERTKSTLKEYKTIVYTAIPLILVACAFVIYLIKAPIWRASMVATIAMLAVILLIDGLAHARISDYHKQLTQAQQELEP